MDIRTLLLLFVLCISSSAGVKAQRFQCDGQLLIGTSDGVSTTISRPRAVPFSLPFLSPLSIYVDGNFDALGFNPADNYIYGVEQNTNTIVRLRRDNTFERLGQVGIVDELQSLAADCTPDGSYLCYESTLRQLLVFDVVDQLQLVDRIDLYWDPTSGQSGSFATELFDFAVDPNEPGVAYAHQGTAADPRLAPAATKGKLLRIVIDPSAGDRGMVTPLDQSGAGDFAHVGSLLFSPQSQLYGYGTNSVDFNAPQNIFYSIDQPSGQSAIVLINNTPAISSDGCACPYSFTFTNTVPTAGFLCNNDRKDFILRIENNTFAPLEGLTLTDTFPLGMRIEAVSPTFSGNILAGTGVGTDILHITELAIPAKSTIVITVEVLSIDAVVGPTYNQAFLSGLPARFGTDILPSDDTGTVGVFGDSSYFFVEARELDDISWTVTLPTDCLEANDGRLTVTSPQFFEGQEFEVRLRNKIGWEETTTVVVIDQDNSFTIDSLIPGDYQLYSLRSLSDNCSLALKDTTLMVEAPNDLLNLSVGSNSPICEGTSLSLSSNLSPSGSIRWTGPSLFGSETPDPILADASPDQTGEYKAVATYGYCEQTELLSVTVSPSVQVTVQGDSVYCERDDLLVSATGQGDILRYSWSGPDGSGLSTDSLLQITNLSSEQQGDYEVIASNAGCTDTTRITIDILPTPTLSLPPSITTDFCSPVVLAPELSGDTDVRFRWTPDTGLSCTDCPTPQVLPIAQPSYQLQVENDFLCTDSASVRIVLDKENLVFAANIFNLSSVSGNDQFAVRPGCVVHYIHRMEVYDRWGHTVFTTSAVAPEQSLAMWNGFISGTAASNGVYVWFAKVELVDGSIEYLCGDVTLLGR